MKDNEQAEIELTEEEKLILSALRDPVKGPIIREILESDDE